MFSSTTGSRDNPRNLRQRFGMRNLHSTEMIPSLVPTETCIMTSDV